MSQKVITISHGPLQEDNGTKQSVSTKGGDNDLVASKSYLDSESSATAPIPRKLSEVVSTFEWEPEEPKGLALPPPPDGGYGWVVVLATFISNFVVIGTNLSFGMFLEPLVEAYEAQHRTVALIRSIMNFTLFLGMTLFSALINRFGAQLVFFCGCILASISFFVMPFTRQVVWVYISCSITGAGISAAFLASLILTNQYFEKRRALACGLVFSGSALGQSGMSYMISRIIKSYSWKSASLVTGFLMLGISLLTPLMRNLKLVAAEGEGVEDENDDDRDSHHLRGDNASENSADQRRNEEKLEAPVPESARKVSIVAPVLANGMVEDGKNQPCSLVASLSVYDMNRRRSSAMLAPISMIHAGSTALGTDAITFSRRPSLCVTLMQTAQSDVNGPAGPSSKANRRASVAMVVEERRMSYSLNQGTILSSNTSQYSMRPFARRDTLFEGSVSKLAADMIRKRASLKKGSLDLTAEDTKCNRSQEELMKEYRSLINAQADYSALDASCDQVKSLEEGSKEGGPINQQGGIMMASHLDFSATEIVDKDIKAEHDKSNRPFLDAIRTLLDFRLLTVKSFQLALLGWGFTDLGLATPFAFLPSLMYQNEMSPDNISYCISTMGIANLAGRLISGFMLGLRFINSSHFSNLIIALTGVTICFLPLCHSYEMFMAGSVAFGLTAGVPSVALTLVLTDMYGIESLTSALGLLGVVRSITSFIGPVLTGFLFDNFGTYLYSFLVMGIAVLIGGTVNEISYLVRMKEVKAKQN